MSYYVKVATRSAGSRAKGSPRQALAYIADGHDSRRDPGYSNAELEYIARTGPGWKSEMEGGRVPLVGLGELAGVVDPGEMRRRFEAACQPRHDPRATVGYRSFTLTVPKEVSLFAEGRRTDARAALHAAAGAALEAIYGSKEYVAVGAVHTRNEVGEIHHHVHVLVAKFARDKATGRVTSLATRSGGSSPAQLRRFKDAWKDAVDREFKERLGLGIEQRKANSAPALVLPNGARLEPLNRASRRLVEKELAAQVELVELPGAVPASGRARFRLTAMDDRILELAAGEKGGGWDRKAFVETFAGQARFVDRYEKRVETLKAAGYLTPDGRATTAFRTHFAVRHGGISPELQRLRADLASKAARVERGIKSGSIHPATQAPRDLPAAMDRFEKVRRRVDRLGLQAGDIRRIEQKADRQRPTPERLRELCAEIERRVATAPPENLPKTKGVIRAWVDVQGSKVAAIYLMVRGVVTFRWTPDKRLADELRDKARRDLFFAKEKRIAQVGRGLRPVMWAVRVALPIRARRLDLAIARCQRLAARQEVQRAYWDAARVEFARLREMRIPRPVRRLEPKPLPSKQPARATAPRPPASAPTPESVSYLERETFFRDTVELPRELEHARPQVERIQRRAAALSTSTPFDVDILGTLAPADIDAILAKHKGSSLLAEGPAWSAEPAEALRVVRDIRDLVDKRMDEDRLLGGLMRGRGRDFDGPGM